MLNTAGNGRGPVNWFGRDRSHGLGRRETRRRSRAETINGRLRQFAVGRGFDPQRVNRAAAGTACRMVPRRNRIRLFRRRGMSGRIRLTVRTPHGTPGNLDPLAFGLRLRGDCRCRCRRRTRTKDRRHRHDGQQQDDQKSRETLHSGSLPATRKRVNRRGKHPWPDCGAGVLAASSTALWWEIAHVACRAIPTPDGTDEPQWPVFVIFRTNLHDVLSCLHTSHGSIRRISCNALKQLSLQPPFCSIEPENPCRYVADWSETFNSISNQFKMICPTIGSRIEEPCVLLSLPID
jgi:hypothetical protein